MNSDDTAGRLWLTLAAALSFGLAALHAIVIVVGPAAYTYFGAGDLAPLAAEGSPLPALLTLLLVIVFATFGFYALAGAARVRRLPLLTLALPLVGAVYTLRGLAVVPELYQLARGTAPFPPRYLVFSAVSLGIGIVHLLGLVQRWRWLRSRGAA